MKLAAKEVESSKLFIYLAMLGEIDTWIVNESYWILLYSLTLLFGTLCFLGLNTHLLHLSINITIYHIFQ